MRQLTFISSSWDTTFMPLPKSLTTITPLSKALAMILFILFPFVGFYLGVQYEKKLNPQTSQSVNPPLASPTSLPTQPFSSPTISSQQPISITPEENEVFCTQDAKMCPDGSFVGRGGPSCEFRKCPGE